MITPSIFELLITLNSLQSMTPEDLIILSCNATSSRVLDAALESPNVPLRLRKRLVISFIGQFHLMVDDRIGCRVAQRCWAAADPYLKVLYPLFEPFRVFSVSNRRLLVGKNRQISNSSRTIHGRIPVRSLVHA